MSWYFNLWPFKRAEVKGATGLSLAPMYGSGGLFSRPGVSQDKLMQEARGWVYACISKIAESVGSVRLRLYRMTGGDRKEWQEIEDHPLLDLLNKPSATMAGFELKQLYSMHEDLTGNAYWLLDGVKDERGVPTAIYPLNPAYLAPKVGRLPEMVTGYKYTNASDTRELKPYEILHFRRPSPGNPYIGLGPTEASMDAIDTDNWTREWNRRFFQNAGRPSMVLESDSTDPEMIRLLRESFDDKFAGVSKAHKTAVLPQGVKIASDGFNQKDVDFVESRRLTRDEILAQFGVPGVVLGLGLGETINRASAETLEYVYTKHTVRPKLARFVAFLNEFLVPRYGEDLILEFDDPVPENTELRFREHEAALAKQPYKSVNEVRVEEGLEPFPGGDGVMASSLYLPVGNAPSAKSAPRQAVKAAKPVHAKRAERRKKLAGDLAEKVVATLQKTLRERVEALQAEDWSPRWEALVKRVSPYEPKFKEAMAAYAKAMTKRAQANLNEAVKAFTPGIKAVDIDKLLDERDEVGAIIKATGPIYQKVLKQEGQVAAEMVGAAFDETDARVQDALEKSIGLMANDYTKTTRAALETQLQEGLAEGEGLDDLADRVATIGAWSETTRAERVARTETYRTANFATREAWRQSGVVQSVKWYTADDERVCPECDVMNDTVVGIDQTFQSSAEDNDIAVDYGDLDAPPLHPNCRCYIRPDQIEV